MKRIHVVAAVIQRDEDVLLARRPDHVHQGGKWEFPGGKVEAGEFVTSALVRELEEELGIVAQSFSPLINIAHDYADKHVLLDVWRVTEFSGEPCGMEGQEVRWVDRSDLNQYEFPAANVPIVTAAQLPQCYVITPDLPLADPAQVDSFLARLEELMCSGFRLFQLRFKQADTTLLQPLMEQVATLRSRYSARVLVNSDMPAALQQYFDGVHLTARALNEREQRPAGVEWVAASCHSPQELERAEQIGVDFVTLSPVRQTASHPGVSALGATCFADWVVSAKMPVYALGGVGVNDLEWASSLGAQGVAGIRDFWAFD